MSGGRLYSPANRPPCMEILCGCESRCGVTYRGKLATVFPALCRGLISPGGMGDPGGLGLWVSITSLCLGFVRFVIGVPWRRGEWRPCKN